MLRSIPLTHLITGIVTLGAAHACYYYYYIEDPNNFAYRYCSVGCGESVKPGDANYAQCCVPLSSGAPTPSTCTVLASSASAAGTMCSWSAVPTTDMKPPTTSMPTTNKINAMPTASCETTWVTMTAIPSACPPTQTPIVSSSSRFSSYSPPSTSKIEALPTSDIYTPPRPSPMTFPTPTSDLTISNEPTPSLDKPEPPSYKANNTPLPSPPTLEYSPPPVLSTTPTPTSSSIWSSSSSSTASTSEIKVEPTCKCGPLPQGAGSLPPAGFSRRSLPPDDCSCEAGALPPPEPESSTLPSTSEIKALPTSTAEPALSSTCLCPKAPVGAGSLPKEPIAKRFSGDDCVCEDESTTAMSSLPPSISEIKALPTSTPEPSPSPKCSCPPAPVGAGSLPKEPMDKRSSGDECDCGTEPSVTSIESTSTPSTSVIKALPTASHTETAPEPSCSCGPLPAGAGSLPKEPIARRSEDGKCDCGEAPPAVPEPNEECDCDEGPLPMGSGSTPPDNSNWKRTQTGCNCPPKPCQEIAPVGAGATPPEGFDAMLKRDESRAVGGPGGGGVGQPGVLEAKPISEDQKFDGLRKRRLPPASLQPEEEPVPDLPSPGALMPTASTSKIRALPTSADTAPTPPPKEEPPVPSKCVTTMTTTITPSCTPVAGSGLSGAGTDHGEVEDEYDGVEDCDEDDETFDLEDPDASNMSSAQSAGGASSTSEIAGSSGPPSATATGDSNGKDDVNVPFPARPGNSAATPSESSDLEELGFGKGGSEPLDFESLE